MKTVLHFMDTPFKIRNFKITTPLGGTLPYKMYESTPPLSRERGSLISKGFPKAPLDGLERTRGGGAD